MSRTASQGITVSALRSQAQAQFPGRTAVIFRLGKNELLDAISTGVLPTGDTGNGIVTRTAIMPSGGIVDNHNLAISQFALALETLTQDCIRPVSESDVRAIVSDMLAGMPAAAGAPQSLSITINDLPGITVDTQHTSFPLLLAVCTARVPCMMVGPAGSGKTSAAIAVAKAMGLTFHSTACNEQMSPAGLLGFTHANGGYVRTAFREAYEHGGIFLLDEMDRGRPAVLTALNMALANGHMTFPDLTIERHADFIVLAGCNTYGNGADRQYTTAQQLDAATLDRFFALKWDYDKSLTRALLGLPTQQRYAQLCKSGYTIESWVAKVESVMDKIESTGARHLVTPRACLYGAKLLDVMPCTVLENGLIYKGANEATRKQIGGGC